MVDEIEALKKEIGQLEANYEFLLNYYRLKIKEKQAELDKLKSR
jgi:hypothetical protein